MPSASKPVDAVSDEEVDVRADGRCVEPPSRSGVTAAARAPRSIAATLSSSPWRQNLTTERDGDVLRITLARPDRRNAFDAAVIAELAQAFVDVGRARAVVLAGDGPSFSAGADVEWMRSSADLSYEENVADANALRAMLEAIDALPGAGRRAGAGTRARRRRRPRRGGRHRDRRARRGVRLLGGEARDHPRRHLPLRARADRPGAARRYFVTGERFDAETALRIGLVHEVADDLDAAVERVVGELLSAGPQAARWAKRLVRERPDGPETARWIAERRTSDEGQEGLRAFLEKRPPSWR